MLAWVAYLWWLPDGWGLISSEPHTLLIGGLPVIAVIVPLAGWFSQITREHISAQETARADHEINYHKEQLEQQAQEVIDSAKSREKIALDDQYAAEQATHAAQAAEKTHLQRTAELEKRADDHCRKAQNAINAARRIRKKYDPEHEFLPSKREQQREMC